MKTYKRLPLDILDKMSLAHPHLLAFTHIAKMLPVLPRGKYSPLLKGNDILNVKDSVKGNYTAYTGYIVFIEKGDTLVQSVPTQILVNTKTGKVDEFSERFSWDKFSYVNYIGLHIEKTHPFSWVQNYQYLVANSPLALVGEEKSKLRKSK